MKKRCAILMVLLTLALFLGISAGVSAETEDPWIVVFDDEHYSATQIQAVAAEYDLEWLLDSYYAADESVALALKDHPMVLCVEVSGTVFLGETETSAVFYNDPYYSSQWALQMVNVEKCWKNYTTGSKDVVVCVIDSGFFVGHEDADSKNGNFKSGKDYIQSSETEEVLVQIDSTSHGTSCAGLIGAISNNGKGIAGMLKDVTVVSERAFFWDDVEQQKKATLVHVAQAIRDAVDVHHADVISMSFLIEASKETSASLGLLKSACEYAYDHGAILVAAAGNNADSGSTPQYPAAFNCVIGVGAVNSEKNVASFSARNSSVYCCAPGVNIRALRNPYSPEDVSDDGNIYYRLASGTSLATPFVSSLAALARSYDNEITPKEFMDLLKRTCQDLGDPGYDTSYGYGLIDCEKLLKAVDDKISGNVFEDVSKSNWYYDSVLNVYRKKLMVGLSDTRFGPETELTRGMFVTILYRMEGEPAVSGSGSFTDVESNSWYQKAVIWGEANHIVYGVGENRFAPNQPINRQEVVTMLYRYYTDYKKVTLPADESKTVRFEDADTIASWAKDSVAAMVKAGIINGYSLGDGKYVFRPLTNATRAVAAQIISGLCDLNFDPETPDDPPTDPTDPPTDPTTPTDPTDPTTPTDPTNPPTDPTDPDEPSTTVNV